MADGEMPGTDVGPLGVDEPAPPGMEEDEAPLGVKPSPPRPTTCVPAARPQTSVTISSQAFAHAGHAKYGAYHATNAGYGYNPHYWNYYTAGGYYQPAYADASTGGYAYQGYAGCHDAPAGEDYPSAGVTAPVPGPAALPVQAIPSRPAPGIGAAPPATVAAPAPADHAPLSAPPGPAAAAAAPREKPPGALPSPLNRAPATRPAGPESVPEGPVLKEWKADSIQVQASATADSDKLNRPSLDDGKPQLDAERPQGALLVEPPIGPAPEPTAPSRKENGPDVALHAQLEATWAESLQVEADIDEAVKTEQQIEPEAQNPAAAKAKAGRVMLRGARLAVTQTAASVMAVCPVGAPKPVIMDVAPLPPAQPFAPKQSLAAKPGLFLPERISAIAARAQQAEELQARRARRARSASPVTAPRSASRLRSRSHSRTRPRTMSRRRALSPPRRSDGRSFRSRSKQSPAMDNRSRSHLPSHRNSGVNESPDMSTFAKSDKQFDQFDCNHGAEARPPVEDRHRKKDKRNKEKRKHRHRRREGSQPPRETSRWELTEQSVDKEGEVVLLEPAPSPVVKPAVRSSLPSPPRISELRARRTAGVITVRPHSPSPSVSASPPPSPRLIRSLKAPPSATADAASVPVPTHQPPYATSPQSYLPPCQLADVRARPVGLGKAPAAGPDAGKLPSADLINITLKTSPDQGQSNKSLNELERFPIFSMEYLRKAYSCKPMRHLVTEDSQRSRKRDRSASPQVEASPREDTDGSEEERQQAKKERKRLKREKKAAGERERPRPASSTPKPVAPAQGIHRPAGYYQHDGGAPSPAPLPAGAGRGRGRSGSPIRTRSRSYARSCSRGRNHSWSRSNSPSYSRSRSPGQPLPRVVSRSTPGHLAPAPPGPQPPMVERPAHGVFWKSAEGAHPQQQAAVSDAREAWGSAGPKAIPGGAIGSGEGDASPPKMSLVLRFSNMTGIRGASFTNNKVAGGQVKRSELVDPEEYEEVLDNVRCDIEEKYGTRDIVIPKPGPSTAEDPPGVGLVFVEFEQQENATRAQAGLSSRRFWGRRIAASFYKAAAFHARSFE